MRRLVIRPGGIGDLIVSLPALESLKTAYLEVWTTPRNVPLVRFADRVRPIDATGLDLVGIMQPALPAFRDFGAGIVVGRNAAVGYTVIWVQDFAAP